MKKTKFLMNKNHTLVTNKRCKQESSNLDDYHIVTIYDCTKEELDTICPNIIVLGVLSMNDYAYKKESLEILLAKSKTKSLDWSKVNEILRLNSELSEYDSYVPLTNKEIVIIREKTINDVDETLNGLGFMITKFV